MEIKQVIEKVRPHLTEKRFQHSLRVAETAVVLAERFGADPYKAELAAILHDYAKYRDLDEMRRIIKESILPKDLLEYHHELWHGPVGALLVKREFGIKDPEILDAVHYHTTGRAHMSMLELIIFLADYIEPGRDFAGLEEVRQASETSLIKGAWLTSRNTIFYLMGKGQTVYPDSFHAYNDLTKRLNGGL